MKPTLFTSLLAFALLAAAPAIAETPAASPAAAPARQAAQSTLIIQALAMTLPHTEAIQFADSVDLSGKSAEALTALEKLVGEKKATTVGNLAVTTNSGHLAETDSGKRSLVLQAKISPGNKTVNIDLEFKNGSHRITTALVMDVPGVKFLGSMESPTDPGLTEYIFVRVSQQAQK